MIAIAYLLATTLAQAPGGVVTPATPADKKVCRRDVATGTILPKRECRTAAGWAAIDRQNQINVETARGRSQSGR